jgi:outer membrane protein
MKFTFSAAAGLFETVRRRLRLNGDESRTISGKDDRSMKPCARAALAILFFAIPNAGFAEEKGKQTPTQPAPVDLSQPLTLDRAVKIALENQQTLGIARSQLESARARQTSARAQYFPSIAPTFEYSNQLTTIGGTTGTFDTKVAQIGLRQMIFDMGKREENVKASRAQVQASQFNIANTRQQIVSDVTTDYYELLRRRELVEVAEAGAERARTNLEATRAFVEAGTSPKKDILQAEADHETAKVNLIQAQNNVRLAASNLKSSMGILSMMPLNIPNVEVPAPDPTPDTRSAAEYVNVAFQKRSDLKRDRANIQADRHDVRISEINAGFQVQADFTEGYRVYPDTGENRAFVTSFSYPLFDAGARRAAVQQSRAFLEQSQRQLELSRQSIQLEVEQSYLVREESRIRTQAADAALRAAKENYAAAVASRAEGAGNILDVITAQTQLVTAETNAVQAIYDFHTADARLKRAIAENDPQPAGR